MPAPIDQTWQPGELPGSIAPAPVEQPLPPNQAVLDAIARSNAAQSGQVDFSGFNPYFQGASQPGMSGYFDYSPERGIAPRVFSQRDVETQAGLTPGQLGQGFGPSGGYDNVNYNIPSDRGGFFNFNANSLPTIGEGLSTNNWRLLGMGPGYIMRQGNIINTRDPAMRSGLPAGYDTSYSDTAESGANIHRFVAPGNSLFGRNKWDAYYWPGAPVMGYTRWPMGTNV